MHKHGELQAEQTGEKQAPPPGKEPDAGLYPMTPES